MAQIIGLLGVWNMAHIKDYHTKGMMKLRKLLVDEDENEKYCVIKFPSSVNNNLKNTTFNKIPVTTSSIEIDDLKNNNNTFSDEALIITLLFEDIEGLKNTTNLYKLPIKGFKDMKASVIYKSKTYIVKSEEFSEFSNSIDLYCDTKA